VNPLSSNTDGSGAATTTATAVGDGMTTISADAAGMQGTATMTVTLDQPPVAVDDAATVAEDASATTIDVLANDTDADGGAKTIFSVTQPANGTVVITNAGADLTYTSNADYCNDPPGTTPDTFTYTLSPGGSTATVTVTVTCVDDPPVAVSDAATVLEDAATAMNVLANDTDVDGGAKSITSVTQPTNGTVAITGGGTGLTYSPNANYCNDPPGTTLDTFTYTLSPGSSSATVTVTVTCVNDLPTAGADAFDFMATPHYTSPEAGDGGEGALGTVRRYSLASVRERLERLLLRRGPPEFLPQDRLVPLRDRHDVIHRDPVLLVDALVRRGCAEVIDPHHLIARSKEAVP
jgi:hypothetical protein